MLGYILLVYLLIYFAVAFILPSYRVWKRTNVNPVTFRGADNAHNYIGKLFKIVLAALTAVVIVYAFAPNFYSYLLRIDWLENSIIQYVGIALLLASFGWTILAQIQMGNSGASALTRKKKLRSCRRNFFGFRATRFSWE